jgi:hypothetical protein
MQQDTAAASAEIQIVATEEAVEPPASTEDDEATAVAMAAAREEDAEENQSAEVDHLGIRSGVEEDAENEGMLDGEDWPVRDKYFCRKGEQLSNAGCAGVAAKQ